MIRLIGKISVILLAVAILSLGIEMVYLRTYRLNYQFPRNILIMPTIADKYEIVKVGNSHAEEGVTFKGFRVRSLSLTGVAQSFEYDLATLKMYSRQIKPGAVILIDVSPISFSQKKAGREDSFQTVYYDGKLSPFLIPDLKVEDYIQSQLLPFLRTGYVWREVITTQIRERIRIEQQWKEPAPTPTPTPSAVSAVSSGMTVRQPDYLNVNDIRTELAHNTPVPPRKLEGSVNFIFEKWYRSGDFGQQYFDANRKDLEKMIAYCRSKNWRPVLITIPISKALRKGLMPDYLDTYVYANLKKTDLKGADYFDFTGDQQITNDEYLWYDSDHLNRDGAKIFSYLLLQKLIDKGYLPKQADGYDYTIFQ